MTKITVKELVLAEKKTSAGGREYTLSTFKDSEGNVYANIYGKVEVGQELDMQEVEGKYGKKWEIVKPAYTGASKADKQFKADPDSRTSIEWQTSLKAAVEVVRDYHHFTATMSPDQVSLEDYAKEVDKIAVHFKNLIDIKPKAVTVDETPSDEEVDDVEEVPVEARDV